MMKFHLPVRPAVALAAVALSLLSIPTVRAREEVPVRLEASVSPERARPGRTVTVVLKASIAPGHHIYGFPPAHPFTYPTRLSVTGPPGFASEGPTRAPDPEIHVDDTLEGAEVTWFTGEVAFEQDVAIPPEAKAGEVELTVKLSFLACTEQYCLDPETREIPVTVIVDPSAPTGPEPPPSPGEGPDGAEPGADEVEEAEERDAEGDPEDDPDLLPLLVTMFLGGLGSIVLPCIYPLIPLTVAFFAKHEGPRRAAVGRALLFCLGIVITFTAIGVALGPILQELAGGLLLNAFLFLLMIVLALSLLGMFDLRLPSSWTEKMQAVGAGASFAAPISMGIAFSFASFTCTVGVIGPLLAASSGEWVHSALGMLFYSAGFALPFFVLALFPMLVQSLPRGGAWMNTLKVLLGFFEICFAGYYLWRTDLNLGWGIGTRPIILSLWTVTVLLAGVYLLGKIRLPHDTPRESVPVPRLMGSILAFALGLLLLAGLMNQVTLPAWVEGLLPPRLEAAQAQPKPGFADETFHPDTHAGLWWTSDHDRALEIGRRTNRRIFLNFTGISCSNCRTLEAKFWPLRAVMDEFEEMVLAELWTDVLDDEAGALYANGTTVAMSARHRKLRSAPKSEGGYGTAANPHYVILSPEGKILAERDYDLDLEGFLSFLRTGK